MERMGLVCLCWFGLSFWGYAQEAGMGQKKREGMLAPSLVFPYSLLPIPHSLLETPTFDPSNPLPGKKEATPTGKRAILPTILSLTLAASGIYVAKHAIIEDAVLGQHLPHGSFAVATFAAAMPSIGRLFVPTKHPVRNALLYSSGRMFTFMLFSACNFGVSQGGRVFAEVGFLTFTAVDIGTTFLLRYP
jgi:hypothetical protein